ncbi:angiotensin-converting enzyme-like [Malaya genurostris]|uniref:angiotensin-converting enzyme-like n=1 Tax=Malaya genurostris TaxID=325434 RepID=UPI0026F3EE86|nr:angiotensin-converting enzyme-like [Malaya genurostris]
MCVVFVSSIFASLVLCLLGLEVTNQAQPEVDAANRWFDQMNLELKLLNHEAAEDAWQSSTLPTETVIVEKISQLAVRKAHWERTTCSRGQRYGDFNASFDRALNLLCRSARHTDEEIRNMTKLLAYLQEIYTETEVCVNRSCDDDKLWKSTFFKYHEQVSNNFSVNELCLFGEPDMERIMSRETIPLFKDKMNCMMNDQHILSWAWQSWRLAVGPPVKESYHSLIQVMNVGARRSGFQDIGEVWRAELEMPNLREIVSRLWLDVKPLYQKLHAVVRHFLKKKYPEVKNFQSGGQIPAHLLGDMWSQNWETLTASILPHEVDIDRNFRNSNCSSEQMVRKAEDFYSSMGLPMMTESFWKKSIFERAHNITKCHGTAANMYDAGDFRMITCAGNSMNDFYVILHEMGHIIYYMLAANQPTVFQDGTNSAFQEAVGDTIHLAALSPSHLIRLGFLNSSYLKPDSDDNLNRFDYSLLLKISLTKIPALPFSYIMDQYRWNLFDGSIGFDSDANNYFWYLLESEQGIRPASEIDRTGFFDAAAKYHFTDNTPYVRYFLANFLSFQILEGLCKKSIFGDVKTTQTLPFPLHRCDLYGSKRVGRLLGKALKLGRSQHWTLVLEILTGSSEISSRPLIKYFAPLTEMLDKIIDEWQLTVGW